MADIKGKHAVNSSQGLGHIRSKTQVQFQCTFSKSLFHWEQEETCVKYKSALQRLCSLSTDLFPREVIECGGSLMLEERESVFLLCCCHRLLRARAAPGTNGASSGPLFPSDGHSWGRSATQSWGYTPLHTQLPPPPLLLPPSSAVPLLGPSLQSAAQRSLLTEGEVSVGVPDVGGPPWWVASGSYLPSEKGGWVALPVST